VTSCDEWAGARTSAGYGAIRVAGTLVLAHRLVWMQTNGPIPTEQLVRHRCDNKRCISLEHLELGTPSQNALDYVERGTYHNQNTAKTKCPRGHVYDYFRNGRRYCTDCRRENTKQFRLRTNSLTKETA
jgi:hypothetical protein